MMAARRTPMPTRRTTSAPQSPSAFPTARCAGEVSDVAAEADGDGGGGEDVSGEHEPACEEADRGPKARLVYWNSGEAFGCMLPSRAYAYAVRPAVTPASRKASQSASPACPAAGAMSA